jgi:hypothetical protein
MFIVKRPFRNNGVTLTAGSVISEPAKIKRFKGRVAEGKIVEVNKRNFETFKSYFKGKYGVDIPTLEPIKEQAKAVKEQPTVKEQAKPASDIVKPAVKTTVKTKAATK